MIRCYNVEVEATRRRAGRASGWFFRVRWANGRIAVVSEVYTRKATALRLARKFRRALADGLGSLVRFEDLT